MGRKLSDMWLAKAAGCGTRWRTHQDAPSELGWTQYQLAEKAGSSKSFVSDVENGKRNIGAETLLDVDRAMNVSLDFLMTCKGSGERRAETKIPASLARLAADEGLSVREMLTLLDLQERIIAARRASKRERLEKVDWQEFYESVKKFL
jgi:transcriptional regulator with XRE-family HTH domain